MVGSIAVGRIAHLKKRAGRRTAPIVEVRRKAEVKGTLPTQVGRSGGVTHEILRLWCVSRNGSAD